MYNYNLENSDQEFKNVIFEYVFSFMYSRDSVDSRLPSAPGNGESISSNPNADADGQITSDEMFWDP